MNLVPPLALLLAGPVTAGEPVSCRIRPNRIEVGTFYSGAKVSIDGSASAGSGVVVTISGAKREERFSRKTRFGPVWISGGRLWISGAPSLFLRFCSAPLAGVAGPDVIARHGLDEGSLIARIRVDPAPPDPREERRIRSDYVALKRTEGSYRFGDNGVAIENCGTRANFALHLDWPRRAPPGEYEVRVYELRAGVVSGQASSALSVVQSGFPAWLAWLAEARASLYGLVAVAISALAGFGIDFLTTRILGGKRRAAH